MSHSRRSKGQLFSSDLVLAVALFVLFSGIFATSWVWNKNRIDQAQWSQQMETITYTAADTLVKTSGAPANWETNVSANVTSIGLVLSDRNIEPAKMNALSSFSPQSLRDIFRLDTNSIQVILRSQDGTIIKEAGTAASGDYHITSKRIVSYMGQPAFLEVTVWGNKTTGWNLI